MKDKAQKNIKMHSVQFNFIMNAILTVSSFIFPLITFPYISRTLLVDGIGKVNFATSVISYFTMFASLGIPTYGIRACARVRDDREKLTKTAQELIIINLITLILLFILVAKKFISNILGYQKLMMVSIIVTKRI